MSAICFTSRAGTVQVDGSERFHLLLVVQVLAGVGDSPSPLPTLEQLNACLQVGTNPAIFVARLSAQIEFVTWVDGPNRAWLAGIIAESLQQQTIDEVPLLSHEAGWPVVQQLLLASEEEPVFMWSTAGAPWPNLQGWVGSVDEWDALGDELQWLHSEAMLRQESAQEDATAGLAEHPTLVAAPFSRELRPSNWHHYFFAELETT